MPKPGPRRPRFEDLTETTGIPISSEGAQMMYTRYRVAADLARGRRVLEIGCGAGQGFGLLGRAANLVVGGDVSLALLRSGRGHYHQRFRFVQLSADALPFRDAAFDLVLFFEASYYVPDMNAAFSEIARVVGRGGVVLVVNANPQRPDFIRSPHSVQYHTADELRRALEPLGFLVTVEGAFPIQRVGDGTSGVMGWAASFIRKALAALRLVPTTLRGRARLKRIVYGRLLEVPAELPEGFAAVAPRVPARAGAGPVDRYKVLYVTATKAT